MARQLTYYARCGSGCGWTPDLTSKRSVDAQANLHTNKTGHPTISGAVTADSPTRATSDTVPDAGIQTSEPSAPPHRFPVG